MNKKVYYINRNRESSDYLYISFCSSGVRYERQFFVVVVNVVVNIGFDADVVVNQKIS